MKEEDKIWNFPQFYVGFQENFYLYIEGDRNDWYL